MAGSVPKGTDAKSPQERPTRLAGYGLQMGSGRTSLRREKSSAVLYHCKVFTKKEIHLSAEVV